MGATLTKHRTVMQRVSPGTYGNDEGDVRVMTFETIDDDTGAPRESYWLNEEQWMEMGSPEEITVTVEPGDRLNESTQRRVLPSQPHDYEGDGVTCLTCGLRPDSFLHPGYDPAYAGRRDASS